MTIVSLSSLTIFLIPLIALLLSYDAIVGEIDRGTMALLLSYPVARWQVVIGKFFGHLAILAFATLIGYGFAGLGGSMGGQTTIRGAWAAFAFMIATSALLGGVFVAIGYFISALVRDRGTAGGVAIGVWLFFVLLYDMALLGGLVVDQGRNVTPGDAERPAAAQSCRRLSAAQSDHDATTSAALPASPGLAPMRASAPGRSWPRSPPGWPRRWPPSVRLVRAEAGMKRRNFLLALLAAPLLASCKRDRDARRRRYRVTSPTPRSRSSAACR